MVRFEAFVAHRYLHARKKGAFVRVMVAFARFGTALGVFAMIVTLALMTGFREEIQANLFTATAHFTVFPLFGDFQNPDPVLAKLRAIPGVAGASPIRIEKGLLKKALSNQSPEPIVIKAVDPASAASTSRIFQSIRPGRIEDLQDGGIILGQEMAQRLQLKTGDTVGLSLFRLDLGLGGLQPRVAAFRLQGTFQSHISEFDRNWAFIHMAEAQRLAQAAGKAEMIEIQCRSLDHLDGVKAKVLESLGSGHGSSDLRDTNRPLFAALRLEKWIFTAILALIVLVAAFNIVASLVLLITEKRRDLGVFLALGATPKQIQRCFELQGLRIGAVGTLWGLATSIPLCLLADHFRLFKLPAAVYDFITYLPFRLQVLDVLLVAVFPMLVAWLAARYPARKAAEIDAAVVLRSE